MYSFFPRLLTVLLLLMSAHGLQAQLNCASNELIIQLEDQVDLTNWKKEYAFFDLTIIRQLRTPGNIYLISWDDEKKDLSSVKDLLQKNRRLIAAQQNCIASPRNTEPNDALFEEQWNMELIEADRLWDITTGGETIDGDPIVVAVLDSGMDTNHEDLNPNAWVNPFEIANDGIDNDNNGYVDDLVGYNMKAQTNEHPPAYHGTAVSGIVGARGDNSIGLAGLGWNTQLLFFTVSTMDQAVEALYYCREQRKRYNESNGSEGSFVVATNYSLGFDMLRCSDFPIWDDAYDALGSVGILSCGATANEDWNIDIVGDIPSSCASDFLISVTNVNEDDEKVDSAGFGATTIDIGAPGSGAPSTSPFDDYTNFGGTSGATPHVAGAIGLLYSIPCPKFMEEVKADPMNMAKVIKSAILNGVDERNSLKSRTVSGGRLNVWNSFRLLSAQYGTTIGPLELVKLAPNPTQDLVQLTTIFPEPGEYYYRIVNSVGQLMQEGNIPGFCLDSPFELDVSFLRSGAYFVELIAGEEHSALPLIIL